jgi:hypothetical protein
MAATVISPAVWADLVIYDFRVQFRRRWHRRLTQVSVVRRLVNRSYALVGLTDDELSAAIQRAPDTLRLP